MRTGSSPSGRAQETPGSNSATGSRVCQWLARAIHAEPQKAAKISYERSHTGFVREITITVADVQRLSNIYRRVMENLQYEGDLDDEVVEAARLLPHLPVELPKIVEFTVRVGFELFCAEAERVIIPASESARTGLSSEYSTVASSRPARHSVGRTRASMRRDGPVWHLTFGGQEAIVAHTKGLADIAQLVAARQQLLEVVELRAREGRDGGLERLGVVRGGAASNRHPDHQIKVLALQPPDSRRVRPTRPALRHWLTPGRPPCPAPW